MLAASLTSADVNVARGLERRLERLIEGVAGRMFSGRIHPAELAGKLAREADFARFDHPTGPATANLFVIQVHPRDLTMDATELEQLLTAEMSSHTAGEGLRLEGPVRVQIVATNDASPGNTKVHVEVEPGPPVVWARLKSNTGSFDIGRNRALVGRSADADLVLPYDDISRRHAIVHREAGQAWIRDLASANGTTVDGVAAGPQATLLQQGSVVGLASHRFRFVEG